jgi:anti-sigma B factor antagonist
MTANITVEKKSRYTLMRLEGDFNGPEENEELLKKFKELAQGGTQKLLIDLTKVIYLNSSCIGVLLSGNALMKKKDGKIVMFGASDYLENTFNVTKLNLVFDICNDEEEAAAAL